MNCFRGRTLFHKLFGRLRVSNSVVLCELADPSLSPFLTVIHTKNNLSVEFNWQRQRLFDQQCCEALLAVCQDKGEATVTNVVTKPKSKWRPEPMDTIALEKLASRKLKLSAKRAMTIAEKLYTQGYISYPRTETNKFSNDINLAAIAEAHQQHPDWGEFAGRVVGWGPNPRNGKKSDEAHPPIHPTKVATGELLDYSTWKFI